MAYMEWEFYCTLDGLQPLCVICGVTLTSHLMKSSLFQRHFRSFGFSVKGKSMNFINSKRRNLLQQATLEKCRVRLVSVGSLLKKPNKSCFLKVLRF